MERRRATWGPPDTADGSVPMPVRLWQEAFHDPGIYDLEVDTSRLSPTEGANANRQRQENGSPPAAFMRLPLAAGGERPQHPSSSASGELS